MNEGKKKTEKSKDEIPSEKEDEDEQIKEINLEEFLDDSDQVKNFSDFIWEIKHGNEVEKINFEAPERIDYENKRRDNNLVKYTELQLHDFNVISNIII